MGSYGTVWAPYGLLLNRMGTYETVWALMGSYGTVWALMGLYGLLLNRMGTYETVWVRVPIRSHTVFSSTPKNFESKRHHNKE